MWIFFGFSAIEPQKKNSTSSLRTWWSWRRWEVSDSLLVNLLEQPLQLNFCFAGMQMCISKELWNKLRNSHFRHFRHLSGWFTIWLDLLCWSAMLFGCGGRISSSSFFATFLISSWEKYGILLNRTLFKLSAFARLMEHFSPYTAWFGYCLSPCLTK